MLQVLQAANHSFPSWAQLLVASPDWLQWMHRCFFLMIFVTIKLIDVYGSAMQECKGKRRKGSKLMDREGSGGCLKEGEAVIMGYV